MQKEVAKRNNSLSNCEEEKFTKEFLIEANLNVVLNEKEYSIFETGGKKYSVLTSGMTLPDSGKILALINCNSEKKLSLTKYEIIGSMRTTKLFVSILGFLFTFIIFFKHYRISVHKFSIFSKK